jgi:hypothetical protein
MKSDPVAINCKPQERVLDIIAQSQVGGVDYAPGSVLRTTDHAAADYLIAVKHAEEIPRCWPAVAVAEEAPAAEPVIEVAPVKTSRLISRKR